jgi:uncharacterized protein YecE (DUF72 family)
MSAGLSNDEIEDKYFLQAHVEFLSKLNELAHRREPIYVYFNNGQWTRIHNNNLTFGTR